MNEIKTYLKDVGIKPTRHRASIYEMLLTANNPVTLSEVRCKLDQPVDRVTIYRTLCMFLSKGIVDRVMDRNGTTYYCRSLGKVVVDSTLECKSCGSTFDIPSFILPAIYLEQLKDTKIDSAKLYLKGLCVKCNQSEK